jgi:hypothetical protein
VRAELETVISEAIDDEDRRVVPVLLDDTPLPALPRRIRWIDLRDGDETRATNEIMGFAHDQARLLAIQTHLE